MNVLTGVFKQYHYTLLHILVNGKIKIKEYIIFINISYSVFYNFGILNLFISASVCSLFIISLIFSTISG